MTSPRSAASVYAFLAVGAVLAFTTINSSIAWDWLRMVVVVLAVANAAISMQIAAVHAARPRAPGNSARYYWFGSIAMCLLSISIIMGLIGAAGREPPTLLNLPLLAMALGMLTIWGYLVLRSLLLGSKSD